MNGPDRRKEPRYKPQPRRERALACTMAKPVQSNAGLMCMDCIMGKHAACDATGRPCGCVHHELVEEGLVTR